MTVKGGRIKRILIDCPRCKCRFLTEKDLQYHLLTHTPQSRSSRKTKAVLSLDLSREKYAEKPRKRRKIGELENKLIAAVKHEGGVGVLWPRIFLEDRGMTREEAGLTVRWLIEAGKLRRHGKLGIELRVSSAREDPDQVAEDREAFEDYRKAFEED